MLLIYHPDAIEELLVTRNRDFIKSLGVRRLRPLVGDGLFLSEGDTWLRQRRLVQPAFHRQRLAGYGDVMTAFTQRHVAGWKDGSEIDMHAEMMALTQAIVAKTLLLATIAQRFRLSLVPGQRITPTPYVTLRPEPGIRLLLARR